MPKPTSRPTIADRLRRAVRDTGQAVNAIAKAAKIPQPVLHRFMSGERDLTLRTAQNLADYFGLELRRRQ